jgi:multidrug efflux pump subunit AcrB
LRRLILAFISNRVLANVALVIIFFVGWLATGGMVREFFPDFSVDNILISVEYPGADPEETEEGIARKIEEAVEGLEGIKEYNTRAMEGAAVAFMEVQKGHDMDVVKDKVRNAVDAISSFPLDAEKPIIEEMFLREPVLNLALWGDMPERRLKEWAETVREDLLRAGTISQINIFGTRDYEISIEVSEERLRTYGLTFAEVASAVRRSSLNLAGGTLRTTGEEIRVRTLGRKYSGAQFSDIVVRARGDGELIPLSQVATVRDGFVQDPVSAQFNGQPCVMLGVFKTQEEDAIAIAGAVRAFADEQNQQLPEGLAMSVWGDRSVLIEDRISLLVRNGLIGLCLVFCLLWLFLDLRLSFWVSMGIPISLGGALGIMWAIGATINMISLFGLIMVLGIIVDDAIVVGEAIYVHRRSGEKPMAAAVNGVREVGMPVIAAVCTTIVAFLPLAYVGGVMGKFIAVLPVVVIAALAFSLVECLFLLPAHLNQLPDINKELDRARRSRNPASRLRAKFNGGLEWFSAHVYAPFVRRALRWRYVALSVAAAVVLAVMGLIQGGLVKFVLFPAVDGNDLIASIEFPVGTPVGVTRDAVEQTREAIEGIAPNLPTESGAPLIRNIYTMTGQSGEGYEARTGPHRGEVRVEVLGTEERGIHFLELNRMWEAAVGDLPGAVSQTFTGMSTGPPGAAITIRVEGENIDEIRTAASEVEAQLATYEGVYQIEGDYRSGKKELRLTLKPEARTLGVTVTSLARQMFAGYFGEEAVRFQRGRDDIRVRVRYTEDERATLAATQAIRIRTPLGTEVPLHAIANLEYTEGYASISRTNGLRRVIVGAEVDNKNANAAEVQADMEATFFPDLQTRYPGVNHAFVGPQQDSRDAFGSLAVGFPLAMLAIFVIIATVFRSYVQPLVILVTVPFGIIGAVLGHLVLGYDVTMMSMFGMVALAGVVVNDAIVLIECINTQIARGMPFEDAVCSGGVRRFRAIVLTTISTCGGLTPLIIERNLQAQFLVPMALSIAAGVLFATVLTLVFIPCLLGVLNDCRRVCYWLRRSEWPSAESVEPSVTRLQEDPAIPGAATEPVAVPAK